MKIYINNPTDFLRQDLRHITRRLYWGGYSESSYGAIELDGDMRIDNVEFNGSEKLMITFYHQSVERFRFYISKPEFTHLEVRL